MPKILNIIINPNPILRKKSTEINKNKINSKETKEFCVNISETMIKKDGVGLAAPQVGKNIRFIVVNIENKITCMINPIITKKSWAKEFGEEGCLSVPDTFGKVKRHKKIKCLYYDNNGKKQIISAEKLTARIIQHEIDHLDGILFIDYLGK